ncbi:caspase family protein [Nostoc sp. NIES-2111]
MQWEENRTNFDRNLAVVIGINHYNSNGIHDLKTAVGDATTIADLLEKEYAYKKTDIIRLLDGEATLTGLEDLLSKTIPNQLKPTSGDRLIFYYAGHGIPRNSKDGPAGYLVPQDADLNKADSFLSMQYVYEQLSQLTCHHLLVILDCCFAGTFQWAGSRKLIPILETVRREHYDRFIRFPAWQVITSSAHDQEAMDVALDNVVLAEDNRGTVTNSSHSPFALALIEGLQDNRADLIPDGVVTAHELYLYLEQRVSKLSKERQKPGLYPLRREYDRGEFIFTKPGFTRDQLQPAPPLDENNNPYRGLKSFDEKHAQFFFGRQALIEELAKRLLLPNQPLAVVLGVSGSGKSSLVKAGLIPYLRDKQAKQWYILEPMRPGELPFTSLARVFLPVVNANLLEQLSQVSFLDEALKRVLESKTQADQDLGRADPAKPDSDRPFQINETLIKVAELWSSATPEAKLLLIEDYLAQLETLCLPEERQLLVSLYDEILARLNSLLGHLQQYPQYLISAIKTWSQNHPNIKLLLVIDQFEELITASHETQADRRESNETGGSSTTEPKQWQPFLEMLRGAIAACPEEWRVVLTLRSDFEPRFLDSPLKSYWKDARFPVRAMNSDELRQAIEGPALKQALYFEPPELVGKLIDEVGQMPGALPLLSFALSELYIKLHERWVKDDASDRALRIKDYEELGGVAGALTRRATEEYDNLIKYFGEELGKAYQTTMRRVMLRMVTIEGGGVARRRVLESELMYQNAEDNKRVALVSDQLVKARLLVKGQETGESYVEPAHDFLVRGWDKLQKWIKEEQEDLALQQRLTPAANDWSTGKGGLWTREIDRLARLEKIIESSDNNWLNKLETEFVKLSKKQRLDELKEAEERRKLAVSRQLAAQAELARNQQVKLLQRSVLLAIESMHLSPSLEADRSLRSGLNLLPHRITQICHQVDAVAFSPNGQYLAVIIELGEMSQVQVYKVNTGEPVTTLNKYTNISGVDTKQAIAFSPLNEKYLVTVTVSSNSDDTSRLQVWEVATGNEVANIPNVDVKWHPYISQSGLLANTAFSPDGKFIATICLDENTQLVRVWEIEAGQEVAGIPQKDKVDAIAFSPNGEHLYLTATSSEHTAWIRVWEAKTGKEVAQFSGDGDTGWVIGFSPDGQYLVTKSAESLQVWEVTASRLVIRLSEFNGMLQAVTFSPDGKYLSTLSGSRKNFEEIINPYIVQVWEVNSGTEIARVPHDSYSERNFACSSEGKYLATGIVGGIQIWEMSRGDDKDKVASVPGSMIAPITLSQDGKYLATVTEETEDSDNTEEVRVWQIKVWEASTGYEVANIPQEDWTIGSIALSSDGKYLATASPLAVWEVATKRQLYRILQETEVKALAFSAKGEHLYTASVAANTVIRTQVRVWDTATGKQLTSILDINNSSPRAFGLDGKFLAITNLNVDTDNSARFIEQVKVIEVATGREVGRVNFENFWRVDSVALSPDGQYLAMKGIEDTEEEPMYIWEVSTGRQIARITSQWHFGNLALSQRYLALQVLDTVHIFLWRPEDLTNEACARLNRNLTQQEWRQYFPDEPYRKTCPNLP